MASKNKINQLIRDEWNKAAPVATITQIHSGANQSSSAPERNPAIPDGIFGENNSSQKMPSKHWVETYTPSNCDKYEYYRYVWMEGRKLRHRHIPGGNIKSSTSRALRLFVECAIASGKSPTEIVQLIISSTRR